MNDQRQWSRTGTLAAVVGGLALLLLTAGFAGERLARVGEPGWIMLVVLLAVCGMLVVISGFIAWRQHRSSMEKLDPTSVAGLRQRSEAQGAVASMCMMLFLGLPLVLVRQTYWVFAPWAALLSALLCAAVAMWGWRASLRLHDQQYRAMSPPQLWEEMQRHRSHTLKHARRFMIIAGVFGLAQLIV